MAPASAHQARTAGSRTVDGFGCALKQLSVNQSLASSSFDIYRKATQSSLLDQVQTPASDQGFVIGVALQGGHTRRIFRPHHASSHDFTENAIYIRELAQDYKADLSTPFDFMIFQLSPASLATIADDCDMPGVRMLSTETATKDIVLANLARALIPALARPAEANALFVDQMTTAIGTYLIQRYGGLAAPSANRPAGLSRAQEEMAKDILLERLDGEVLISEVAQACNLSRGYFIRAFKEATGMTPYQWLLSKRIDRAKELLRSSKAPLAEIAISCGFADQSHFTRVFSTAVGAAPGLWRRNA